MVMNVLQGWCMLLILIADMVVTGSEYPSWLMMRYTKIDINYAVHGNLRRLSAQEAWETIEDCVQCDKQWKTPTSTISDQTIANLKAQLVENEVVRVMIPKCMSWLDAYDEPIGIPIEVEPLDETPLEDLGLNTLDLGEERGPETPVKPPSPNSFRMKEVDHLTNHRPVKPPNKIACRKFLIKNEEEIFIDAGDGIRIYPDGVASPAM
ncbi:hypothetical protein Tco_1250377 [Tanacetum coccineum]